MNKPKVLGEESYALHIVGKHFQVTEAIQNYVWEKLSKIEKVADHIIDITVTLETQKLEHSCSILMNFIHFHVKAEAKTDNLYSAIDKASDRILSLVRRYKTKLQSHRAKHVSEVDIHVNVIEPLKDQLKQINEDIEEANAKEKKEVYEMHRVVAEEKMKLKTLTQDEAVMKMEITTDSFLIFRSEEDLKLKLIYRRKDQNYGLVEIE